MSGADNQVGRRSRSSPHRNRSREKLAGLGFAKISGHPVLGRLIGTPHPGEIYAIASRPAMGKTAFALAAALNAAESGAHVLYVSADMHRSVLLLRLQAAHSGISLQKLKAGGLSSRESAMAEAAAGSLKRLPIIILDAYRPMAWNEMLEKIEQMMDKSKALIFILDPLLRQQKASPKARISWAGLASAAADLRLLARRTGSIGLVTCGMNRAVESRRDRTPQVSDLRGGVRLAKKFNGILFLERSDMLDFSMEPPRPGRAVLSVCHIEPARPRARIEACLGLQVDSMRIGKLQAAKNAKKDV